MVLCLSGFKDVVVTVAGDINQADEVRRYVKTLGSERFFPYLLSTWESPKSRGFGAANRRWVDWKRRKEGWSRVDTGELYVGPKRLGILDVGCGELTPDGHLNSAFLHLSQKELDLEVLIARVEGHLWDKHLRFRHLIPSVSYLRYLQLSGDRAIFLVEDELASPIVVSITIE